MIFIINIYLKFLKKMNFTYAIFNPIDNFILPDKKKYYNEIKYANCDYTKYFKSNPNIWKFQDNIKKGATFSNYESRSYIKAYSNPLIQYISNKGNLANMIKNETYSPITVVFEIIKGKIPRNIKWNPEKDSLWFLKKSSELTYGGYDVFPIIITSKKEALKTIQSYIDKSNEYKKYYSEIFILQKGIFNPLLMIADNNLKYKFDIRAYGLIVKVSEDYPYEFYFFKQYLNRRSMNPYDKKSTDIGVMLTNTTQAGISGIPIETLTSLGGYKKTPEIYEKIYEVYREICFNHLKKFDSKKIINPSINIIGIDFILDESFNPYILEINKLPAIYCDIMRREKYHHGMEELMFDTDFFDITFKSIIENIPYKFSTENYFHVN